MANQQSQLGDIENRCSFSPMVTVKGTMDSTYTVAPIMMTGVIAPVAGSKYAAQNVGPIRVAVDRPISDFGGPTGTCRERRSVCRRAL